MARGPAAGPQPGSHHGQHGVADEVARGVVDALEVVEVDQQDTDPLLRASPATSISTPTSPRPRRSSAG
jgi:hypothetical protein